LGASFSLAIVHFAEASITSLSTARLKSLKVLVGKPWWEAVTRWIHHPEEYLTLLLLAGNVAEAFYVWALVGIFSLFVSSPQKSEWLVLLVGAPFALLALNLVPKILARRVSQGWLSAVILRVLYVVVLPLYPFLHSFFYFVRKLSGGNPKEIGALGKSVTLSLVEIREILESTQAGDARALESLEMMKNFLRLEELRVIDVMTLKSHVSALEEKELDPSLAPGVNLDKALFSLMTDGHTRTVLTTSGIPTGYIHAKDLARQILKDPKALKVVPGVLALRRPIALVNQDQLLSEVLPKLVSGNPIAGVYLEAQGTRALALESPASAIQNEKQGGQKQWVGIITIEDLLEEVTGEISDEFETRKKKGIRRIR